MTHPVQQSTIVLPGIQTDTPRDVALTRHDLQIGPHCFPVFDFEGSITANHVENELRTPSLLHTLGADFDGCIVDIGANVGIYTVLASKMYPKAKLYSVEPLADTCAVLLENLVLNTVVSSISQAAVSDKNQPMILSWHPKNPGSASVIHAGPELEIVRAERLPSILNELGVDVVDLLKLDIEGLEYAVLHDLSDTDWSRIRRLSVELHGVLIFPPPTNYAIYTSLSAFLWQIANKHGVQIEVRWPNDFVPPEFLRFAWNPASFALLFNPSASSTLVTSSELP